MFGNPSLPSKVFAYGARRPTQLLDLVDEQMYKAHRYRNRLVSIELWRRDEIQAARRRLHPAIDDIETRIKGLDDEILAVRKAIKTANAIARKRTGTGDQREQIKVLKARKKLLYQDLKAEKIAVKNDPVLLAAWDQINATALEKSKNVRASEDAPHWGTYLVVEQGVKHVGKPPRYHRWNGDGHLAVQLIGGLSVAEIAQGHGQFRMRQVSDRHALAEFRLGTGADHQPLMAEIPFITHRPLPEDSTIKWVHLLRRIVGGQEQWELQIVVSRASGWEPVDRPTTGTVGIDVGWRKVPEGLRVASWQGDDGQAGELILPAVEVERWTKVEDLQSIIDLHFDGMRALLRGLSESIAPEWLSEHLTWLRGRMAEMTRRQRGERRPKKRRRLLSGEKVLEREHDAYTDLFRGWPLGLILPDWWTTETRTITAWKSPGRMLFLCDYWAANRFAGDDLIFAPLEQWCRRHRHLHQMQQLGQQRAIRWRTDTYRQFAAMLGRRYRNAFIEDTNWAKLLERPQPEKKDNNQAAKKMDRTAAVGRLLEILRQRLVAVERPAEWSTQFCHACGRREPFDAAKELSHTCEQCGSKWDQDNNAAKNLLSGAHVVSAGPGISR